MSQIVNNFFESLTNSINPRYAGVPMEVHTLTPGNMEGYHQSQVPITPPVTRPFGNPFGKPSSGFPYN
jgi:hypothetical protein